VAAVWNQHSPRPSDSPLISLVESVLLHSQVNVWCVHYSQLGALVPTLELPIVSAASTTS
jgi:hypothetical protein